MNRVAVCRPSRCSGLFLGLFVVATAFFSSCDKGDDPAPTPKEPAIAGQYTLKVATLNKDVAGTDFKKGADIAETLKEALFSKLTCKNQENLAIDLREDKTMYLSCVGESNDLQGGTWQLKDDNKALALNLNASLIGLAVSINVTDLKVEDGVISGNVANLPLPVGVGGNYLPVNIHIEFHTFKS